MTELPRIRSFLTVPGRDAAGAETLAVGIVLDGRQIAWGECLAAEGLSLADFPDTFRAAEGEVALRKTIIPALAGQSLVGFRPLMEVVDALRETALITETIPPPENRAGGTLSRRDLFTGRLWNNSEEKNSRPKTRQVAVERSLHPAVRYGVSQALLAATALARDLTMAEVICEEYELSPPDEAVPFMVEVAPEEGLDERFWDGAASLSLNFSGEEPAAQLGLNGERLQRLTRQLAVLLPETDDPNERPAIHLELGGGLGHLYDHNIGKMLGGLYGLERAAGPYHLQVADPLRLEGRQAHVQKMAELKEYIGLRGMSVRLVARAWLDSLDDVNDFLGANSAHMLIIDVHRLGSLNQAVQAILAAQKERIGVILSGADPRVLCHLALATRPEQLTVEAADGGPAGLIALRQEMDRTLAWISARATTSS